MTSARKRARPAGHGRAIALALFASLAAASGQAAVIDLRTAPLVTGPNSLSFVVDGVNVVVTGYSAEPDEDGITRVFGPYSTDEVAVTSAAFDYFAFGPVRSAASGAPVTGIGLLSNEAQGQSDPDRGSGVIQSGFDNSSLGTAPSLQFAVLAFDAPVDVSQVVVDDVSNFGRSIWAAGGSSSPDFSAGLASALVAFAVVNSADSASDGQFAHTVSFDAIRYLIIGAPPSAAGSDLTALTPRSSVQFYIDGLDVTASPVPLPPALPMLATGMLGLFGWARARRASR